MSAYVTDTAVAYQGSYWPNTPPVLAPHGFYWYDYGPVGRGMNFYRAIPIGKRPSPADQAVTLAKHRGIFARGTPKGLPEALAEHGLAIEPDPTHHFFKNVLMYSLVFAGLGVAWKILGIR